MKVYTIENFNQQFPNDDACLEWLRNHLYPNGIKCPKCQKITKHHRINGRTAYSCDICGTHTFPMAQTILRKSATPLRSWMYAIYLMASTRCGISAKQLQRELGVTYKTAWYLCHRIRAAMQEANPHPLKGIVEVDETWVGGKRKNVGHGFKGNKVIAIGAVERGGDTRLQVIDHADRKTLHGFIHSRTAPDTEAIYTDEWPAYDGIADHDTRHETVNHSAEEWVNGDVHTNTVENVWSLFKRSVIGSYHKISTKHLNAYLDELEWRFNNRDNPYLFRDTLKKLLTAGSLNYKALVS